MWKAVHLNFFYSNLLTSALFFIQTDVWYLSKINNVWETLFAVDRLSLQLALVFFHINNGWQNKTLELIIFATNAFTPELIECNLIIK